MRPKMEKAEKEEEKRVDPLESIKHRVHSGRTADPRHCVVGPPFVWHQFLMQRYSLQRDRQREGEKRIRLERLALFISESLILTPCLCAGNMSAISSTSRAVSLAVLGLVLTLLCLPTATLGQDPGKVDPTFLADFDEEFILGLDDADAPVDLQISPDGSLMLVPEKGGVLWVVQDFDPISGRVPTKTQALTITKLCTNVERGFGGTAFHPNFGKDGNRYIYLYYTYDKNNDCNTSGSAKRGPVNRLSRFVLGANNVVDPSTEQVFFETPILPYGGHNSGQIRFGPDGYLYVSVGDGGGGISQENDNGVLYPQALDMLLGKILRLTDDGNIPPTNPFTDPQTSARCNRDGWSGNADIKCQEIYSYGLRNPFRFALDPNAAKAEGITRLFINDVGRHTWESVHEGGDGFAGANYGYPDREGPCEKKTFRNCAPDSRFLSPIHWYRHNAEEGGAATGNAFYPNDAGWPWHFQNLYFFADYAFGGLYRVTKDSTGACPYPACDPPISEYAASTKTFSKLLKITALAFGPYMGGQALYLTTRGHDGLRGNKGIYRIRYVGPPVAPLPTVAPPVVSTPAVSTPVATPNTVDEQDAFAAAIDSATTAIVTDYIPDDADDDFVLPEGGISFGGSGFDFGAPPAPKPTVATPVVPVPVAQPKTASPTASPVEFNRLPKAIASASTTLGFPPLLVKFDASESYDPDYLDEGSAALKYSWDFDGDGYIDSNSPTASFKYMKSGVYKATLTVRDNKGAETTTSIDITVEDTPPRTRIIEPRQDATFSVGDRISLKGTAFDVDGGLLSDSSITWEVRMHHEDHWHTVLEPTNGNNIVIPAAPGPVDLLTAKNSYLMVSLTATDDAGLSSTATTILKPKLVDFALDSNPSGLVVVANGEEFQTPTTITTWANTEISVEGKVQTDNNGDMFALKEWSDGGAKSHQFIVANNMAMSPVVADFRPYHGDTIVTIDTPADGASFAVGDAISLIGSVSDPDGNALDVSDDMLTWEVKMRNETHSVTILKPTQGNNIPGRGPAPTDFEFAETNYIEITLSVLTMVDGSATKVSKTVNIYPRKVELTWDAIPSGLFLEIDGEMYKTPISFTTWENHAFEVDAPSQKMLNGAGELTTYIWDSWSDNEDRTHEFVTPAHRHHKPILADFKVLAVGQELPETIESRSSDGDNSKRTTIIASVLGVGIAGVAGIVAFIYCRRGFSRQISSSASKSSSGTEDELFSRSPTSSVPPTTPRFTLASPYGGDDYVYPE